jgi:hypothetical protein
VHDEQFLPNCESRATNPLFNPKLKKMKILKISLSVFFLSIFLYSCEPEDIPVQEKSFPAIIGDTGDQEDPIEEKKK